MGEELAWVCRGGVLARKDSMIIGVDGNLLCGKKTGMGTVVHHVIKRWKATEDIRIILYVPGELEEEYAKLLKDNGIAIKNYAHSSYPIWEQIVLPREVKKDKVDVLWCPYNTAPLFCRCKTVVTVHDVIYMEERISKVQSLYKKMGVVYRRLIVPKAAKKAKSITTVSEYAKNEIIRYMPYTQQKMTVAYNGVGFDQKSALQDCSLLDENGIATPYILGFGSLEKRKNSMGLIKAYSSLPQEIKEKYQLVLFGFRGYENSPEYVYIKDNNLKTVKVLGYISDAQKNALYANSYMFVFPSFSEGFGIPILEAYVHKVPVITSNVTSLPEVAGDAAILIDPNNISEISDAMKILIEEPELRQGMVERGLEQYKKFDWDTTAEQILEVLKK